jgi:hypothetical protein
MPRCGVLINWTLALVGLCALASGCGTTKWSDSPRTATEQLLVSDAIDRAIAQIDFSALADKHVYLDTRFIITVLDQNYVISTLRQHMLASGCIIHDKPDDAAYIVEVRTGSLGTNRQDLLFGVPSTTVPTVGLLPTGSATIPEIALMKRTNQQGVCKIAVFAYDRMSGRPVWQSGTRQVASRAKDIWVMGAGPFQRGTIYDGTAFAGERFSVPLVASADEEGAEPGEPVVDLGEEKVFDPNSPDAGDGKKSVNNANYVGDGQAAAQTASATSKPTADASASGASKSGASSDAKPAAAPPAGSTPAAPAPAKTDTPAGPPPKAAYTPPLPPPVALPPPAGGLQGNLTAQTASQPTSNPASTTAGAIQTYNLARDFWDKQKTGSTPAQ